MAQRMKQFTNAHGKRFDIFPASELNLDCHSQGDDYLMSFWAHYQRGRNHKELFPQGGKGTSRATADLACYASNAATARTCRLRGDIETALMYERIADGIYTRLPFWAKGW